MTERLDFKGTYRLNGDFISYSFLTTILLQKGKTSSHFFKFVRKVNLSWFLKTNNIHTMRSFHRLLVVAFFFLRVCIASPMPFQLSSKIEVLRAQGMSEVNLEVSVLMDVVNIFRQPEILSTLNNRHPSPAITVSDDTTYFPDKDGEVSPGALWQPQGEEGRPKWMFSWLQSSDQ